MFIFILNKYIKLCLIDVRDLLASEPESFSVAFRAFLGYCWQLSASRPTPHHATVNATGAMDSSHKRRLRPDDDDDVAEAVDDVGGATAGDGEASKRARTGGPSSSTALITTERPEESALALLSEAGKFAPGRTSSLEAPIMLLTGHAAPVYAVRFSPDGANLASAGKDRDIFIWNVFGECATTQTLKGHKNAVLDLHWSTGGAWHGQ
jgi:WD40 repeat protein